MTFKSKQSKEIRFMVKLADIIGLIVDLSLNVKLTGLRGFSRRSE